VLLSRIVDMDFGEFHFHALWLIRARGKPGTSEEVPDISWKVTLPKPTSLCCDEPRDDTGNHNENRALGH
jgi:hypothetical protein